MPYSSDAQRRFFHSSGAAKVGITPAMVKEWDDASRGRRLPEKVEKQATHAMLSLAKLALMGLGTSTSLSGMGKAPSLKAPAKPLGGSGKVNAGAGDAGGAKAAPFPGDYKPSFLDNSGASAQRASGDKLQAGEALTMPT